jgi:hypothetical protein
MKRFVLLVLVSWIATSSAYAAHKSAGIGSGRPTRNGEVSQFRPQEVVVNIGSRHFDAKESLKRAGLATVSNTGSGYCLGPKNCDFIITNYHVANRVGSPLNINGIKVLQTYEATSAQDPNAVWEKSPQGFSVKLVPVRDIAIFRMQHPLKRMHGIPFSTRQLREGESVRIYGHPGGGKLAVAEATFYREGKDGLLFFRVRAEEERVLVPGISGSLVVNEKNEAVGLLQGVANGDIAAVVPIWSLADFVKKVRPNIYSELIRPDGSSLYRPNESELVPVDLAAESEALATDIGSEVGMSPPSALPEKYLWYDLDKPITPLASPVAGAHVRVEEPPSVQTVRKNAEDMVERINDLIAVGQQRSIGGKTPEASMQYRLRMVSGHQTFTMDGKELP